jgi:hypothetical protein
VTEPDLEIATGLRAKELVAQVPPEARTETEGEDVRLVRKQKRTGLPPAMEADRRYTGIVVEKRLIGETTPRRTT